MLRQIFENNELGFAFLTNKLEIKTPNDLFIKYFAEDQPTNSLLVTELIPETFGLEEVFSDLIRGNRSQFKLLNIRRIDDREKEFYYDIHLLPTDDKSKPLIILIQDVTSETLSQKRIIQKQNELRLSKGMDDQIDENFIEDTIIGSSQKIKTVKEVIKKVAGYENLTVMITGESGTGKNLIARVIHLTASGDEKPYVSVNCASIPESLLESELFGHVKGAFTSASKDKKGLVEEADGGTLFLDEIGEMSTTLQAKLLSFLEEREFRPVGSTDAKKVEVRVIAATNKNLAELVKEKVFREDLYYRLNVVRIDVPPLREMKPDLMEIADNFIDLFNIKYDKSIEGFSEEAEELMIEHSWPGNVRELRNVLERAMVFSEGSEIKKENILIDPVDSPETDLGHIDSETLLKEFSLPEGGISLTELEKKVLIEALESTDWNQSKAAKLLKISREKLRYRIEKYNLK